MKKMNFEPDLISLIKLLSILGFLVLDFFLPNVGAEMIADNSYMVEVPEVHDYVPENDVTVEETTIYEKEFGAAEKYYHNEEIMAIEAELRREIPPQNEDAKISEAQSAQLKEELISAYLSTIEMISESLEIQKRLEKDILSLNVVVSVDSKTGGKGFARIFGGSTVPKGKYQHCTAVGDQTNYFCSGTLIAKRLVVTAAHCLPGVKSVFFGRSLSLSGNFLEVSKAIKHPFADLAVLVLAKDSNVEPVMVAKECHLKTKNKAVVVGFGTSNMFGTIRYRNKRYVEDLLISDRSCSNPVEYGCKSGIEMVIGLRALNKDSCQGDSGGPAYIKENGKLLLVGATSRGVKSSTRVCGDGGIYVRVDKFIDWIESETGFDIKQPEC